MNVFDSYQLRPIIIMTHPDILSQPPIFPKKGAGAKVGIGMFRGGGIPPSENNDIQMFKFLHFTHCERIRYVTKGSPLVLAQPSRDDTHYQLGVQPH